MVATPPALDSVVLASDAPLAAPLGREVVLLHPEHGTYYSLNEVGARVWALIQHPTSVRGVCTRIVEEFDVDVEICEADVLRLVKELVENGLAAVAEPEL